METSESVSDARCRRVIRDLYERSADNVASGEQIRALLLEHSSLVCALAAGCRELLCRSAHDADQEPACWAQCRGHHLGVRVQHDAAHLHAPQNPQLG